MPFSNPARRRDAVHRLTVFFSMAVSMAVALTAGCGSNGTTGSKPTAPFDAEEDGGGAAATPGDDGGASAEVDAAVLAPREKVIKAVFMTAATFDGDLGGLAGADEACRQTASKAGLAGGGWKALLSTASTPAPERIRSTGPWDFIDGQKRVQAESFVTSADFWNSEKFVWLADEHGEAVVGDAFVWTGASYQGADPGWTCSDWTSRAGGAGSPDAGPTFDKSDGGAGHRASSGAMGNATRQVAGNEVGWPEFAHSPCANKLHLLCVEDDSAASE